MWRPEITQTSGFSIDINLINNCSLRTSNYSAKHICYYFHHSKGIISFDKLFFSICDGLLCRHINVTQSKLGELGKAIFSKQKTLSR